MINFLAKILPLLGLLLLALLSVACSPNVATAKRGSVEAFRDGRMTSSRQLVETEARAVSAWFKANTSGWSRSFSPGPPALMIRLQHSNREATVLNLSGDTVVVTNSNGQFTKTLPAAEAEHLRALAGEPPTKP